MIKEQDYTPMNGVTQEIRVGIRKEIYDEIITDYGKNIDALRSSETLTVDDVSVDSDIVVIKATLTEEIVQWSFLFDEDQLDIFFDDTLVTLSSEQVDLLFMFLGNYDGKIW